MKLYDFSLYAQRRQAERAVAEIAVVLDKPGSVIELKHHVQAWLNLHREVLRRRQA